MRASLLHRIVALLFGLVYLPLGLVWAYWFALLVMPLGLLGLGLLRIAERRAPRAECGVGERRLHQAALVVVWMAFAASLVALGVMLVAG
jgi:hypothetical protein